MRGQDDYKSDPAGNAGDRIACGVVGEDTSTAGEYAASVTACMRNGGDVSRAYVRAAKKTRFPQAAPNSAIASV